MIFARLCTVPICSLLLRTVTRCHGLRSYAGYSTGASAQGKIQKVNAVLWGHVTYRPVSYGPAGVRSEEYRQAKYRPFGAETR